MASNAWKEWERIVATKIFGSRRGAYTGSGGRGKTDVIHPVIAAECKFLSSPQYADIKKACNQAKDNAEPGQIPIAFIRKKGDLWGDALVVMKLEEFAKLTKIVETDLPMEEDEK